MDALKLLSQDHEQIAALFHEFQAANEGDKTALAEQICQLLTLHAQVEEELLYPAARGVLKPDDEALVNEATVEHASLKDLVGQIETTGLADELYEAKVNVLGEYVTHHVQEEENELFPRLRKAKLNLNALGFALAKRKRELMTELGISADDAIHESDNDSEAPAKARLPPPKSRTSRRSGNQVKAR